MTAPMNYRDSGQNTNPRHPLLRRMGAFKIAQDYLKNDPELVQDALKGSIVVRCELRFDTMALHYVALHPDFDECPEHMMAPEYDLLMETVDVGTEEEPEWRPRFRGFTRLAK